MAKKLRTLYQVCPDEGSGWNTLHVSLVDAVKEAREFLDRQKSNKALHICQLREVKQVKRPKK